MEALRALGLEPQAFITQVVNFILLLILLRMFLYGPIFRMLDRRAERIRESLRDAEEIKQQLARTQEEYQARLAEARREAQAVLSQANEAAKRTETEASVRAQRQAEELIERARGQIELEKQQAIATLRAEVADLVIDAAERVTRQALDRKAHLRLIDDALAETGKLRVETQAS